MSDNDIQTSADFDREISECTAKLEILKKDHADESAAVLSAVVAGGDKQLTARRKRIYAIEKSVKAIAKSLPILTKKRDKLRYHERGGHRRKMVEEIWRDMGVSEEHISKYGDADFAAMLKINKQYEMEQNVHEK